MRTVHTAGAAQVPFPALVPLVAEALPRLLQGKSVGLSCKSHTSALLNHRAEQPRAADERLPHGVQEMPTAQSTYVWTTSLCSMMLLPKVPLVFSTTCIY